MNDRSDEVTERREPRSTDDLLAETEQLLSDEDGSAGPNADSGDRREPVESGSGSESTPGFELGSQSSADPTAAAEADGTADRSRLAGLAGRLSLAEYFSPKAFLALVLAIGAGLFVGDAVLPVAGRPIGIFATAFLIGLVASKRRYLELTAAGVVAGAITQLVLDPVYVALGSGWTLAGIGAAIGLVASVGGYYFGRDLRDGILRDVP